MPLLSLQLADYNRYTHFNQGFYCFSSITRPGDWTMIMNIVVCWSQYLPIRKQSDPMSDQKSRYQNGTLVPSSDTDSLVSTLVRISPKLCNGPYSIFRLKARLWGQNHKNLQEKLYMQKEMLSQNFVFIEL